MIEIETARLRLRFWTRADIAPFNAMTSDTGFMQFTGAERAMTQNESWQMVATMIGHWGQGYASEASKAALGFAFEQMEAEEVIAIIRPKNAASISVAQRIGQRFRRIGLHQGNVSAFYTINREEWLSLAVSPAIIPRDGPGPGPFHQQARADAQSGSASPDGWKRDCPAPLRSAD